MVPIHSSYVPKKGEVAGIEIDLLEDLPVGWKVLQTPPPRSSQSTKNRPRSPDVCLQVHFLLL